MMCSANIFPFSWVELQEILFVCLFSETVGLLLRFLYGYSSIDEAFRQLSISQSVSGVNSFRGISVMWTRTAFGQLCVCACLLIPTTEQTTAAFVVLPLNHRLRVAANNTRFRSR